MDFVTSKHQILSPKTRIFDFLGFKGRSVVCQVGPKNIQDLTPTTRDYPKVSESIKLIASELQILSPKNENFGLFGGSWEGL